MSQLQKPGLYAWSLLIVLTIIWGFSYYFIKHSLVAFNPAQVASLRMVFSAVALSPFLLKAFKTVDRASFPMIFFVGFIGAFLPAFLYPFAQQKISSSLAGIINAFTPICTFGIGVLFFNVKNERSKLIGTIIALFGAFSLILLKPNAEIRAEGFYLLVAFAAPLLYGLNGNTIKSKLGAINGIQMTALMYFFMTLYCLPLSFWNGAFQQIPVAINTGNAFYHLIALSVLGSAVAMALFNVLIQKVHVMFAASVTYLMPLVSLFVGFVDGEKLGLNDIVGLVFILTGVLIINGLIRIRTGEQLV